MEPIRLAKEGVGLTLSAGAQYPAAHHLGFQRAEVLSVSYSLVGAIVAALAPTAVAAGAA